jgi:hypothetical protein
VPSADLGLLMREMTEIPIGSSPVSTAVQFRGRPAKETGAWGHGARMGNPESRREKRVGCALSVL